MKKAGLENSKMAATRSGYITAKVVLLKTQQNYIHECLKCSRTGVICLLGSLVCSEAVSYTHLDVYKRQTYNSPLKNKTFAIKVKMGMENHT